VLVWGALIGCRAAFDRTDDAPIAKLDSMPSPPAGAAIAFHFDEDTGTTTTSEDGTTAPMVGADWTAGIRGSAVHVQPTGYIDLPTLPRLVIRGALTISIWYRLDAMFEPCMCLVIHGGPNSGGAAANATYALNLLPPAVQLYSEVQAQTGNSTMAGAPADAFEIGTWHHVVAVRDAGNNVVFYFDGATSFASTTPMPITGGDAGHLRIGNDLEPSGCIPVPGRLDELYIYPRALTIDEIGTLFAVR